MSELLQSNDFIPIPFQEEELIPLEHINEVQQMPDGSSIYEIGDQNIAPEIDEQDFYENLALKMSDTEISRLASDLINDVSQDITSRQEWDKAINTAFKYLGLKVEEMRSMPFLEYACSAIDSTLVTALLRAFSTAKAELFPAAGPAKSQVIGVPTDEVENAADRVKMFLNYYLTKVDKVYYPDSEKLLMYVIFFGCAFRKVYQDPILNMPVARFVAPQDFIVNNHTTSILSSSRLTEIMELSRKDVLLRQQNGDFVKFKLPKISDDDSDDENNILINQTIKRTEGIDTDSSENKSLFKFYEIHCELTDSDLFKSEEGGVDNSKDDDGIPKPYIVTVCLTTRKVVAVRRNWREMDDSYRRREYYVHYSYLPGFGIYSLGLAQLCGSSAIALTSILRQLVDAGSLRNFPGGLMRKGMRLEDNDKEVGIASWHEVETRGMPLQSCVMPMPYGEPSQVLMELRREIKGETESLTSVVDSKIPEIGANAPVGTTLAVLETVTQLQSCVLRSLHTSLGCELQLLFSLFGEYLPDTPYPFAVPGKETAIMKRDFNDKVSISPVSDPNVLTSTHRLLRNEAILKLAISAPQIHDLHEAYRRMYESMNVENVDKILPDPPPPLSLDPVSEDMLMMSGRKVISTINQNHEAHKIVHKRFIMNPMTLSNPQVYSTAIMHLQEHECLKVYADIQRHNIQQNIESQLQAAIAQGAITPEMAQFELQNQMANLVLPDVNEEQLKQIMLDTKIQNIVAQQNAQETLQEMQAEQQQASQQIDINHVALADVEQKREASHLKAQETKEKITAEMMKAELRHDAEMTKTASQRDTAREKHEVDLLIAHNKADGNKQGL